MSDDLLCTNYGCNKKFKSDEICVYHSGEPFFHDAYKGWTCCQQKSTDFTTFLSFKGCKTGNHCSVKKEPKIKPQKQLEPIEPQEEEEIQIDCNVWINGEIKEAKTLKPIDPKPEVVICRKCRKSDVKEECVFHSGQVIFHETLKYWTCCPNKKFTDFQDFQDFPGCQSSAQHEMTLVETKAREDWFQTNTHVTIILYGLKGSRAQYSSVTTNGSQLKVEFKDINGFILFARDWQLEGLVSGCRALISSNKVEIYLEKAIKNKFWLKLNSN